MRSLLASTLVAAATAITGVSAGAADNTTSTNLYDYIIVGGGPSGIIAATRLAQASSKKVLLLSRGQGPTVDTGAVGTVGWNDSLTPIDVPGLSTAVADYNVGDESLVTAYLCDDTSTAYAACVFGGGATVNCKFPYSLPVPTTASY